MEFFSATKRILTSEYNIDAKSYDLEKIKKIISAIPESNDKFIEFFKMEEYIYQFHFKIDYNNLYDKRAKNYSYFIENNNINILSASYSINPYGELFFVNRDNKEISPLSDKKLNRNQFLTYMSRYSINKEWGYDLFLLRNYDLILIDILKLNSNISGYDLRDALIEKFSVKSKKEINNFTINLLKKFTLTLNGLNIM